LRRWQAQDKLKICSVIYRELETIGDAQCLAPSMDVGMIGLRRETVMISLEDCIGLSGLDEEQVAAISEHDHIPETAAAGLAGYLLKQPHGRQFEDIGPPFSVLLRASSRSENNEYRSSRGSAPRPKAERVGRQRQRQRLPLPAASPGRPVGGSDADPLLQRN
jgi:hypothetical protein